MSQSSLDNASVVWMEQLVQVVEVASRSLGNEARFNLLSLKCSQLTETILSQCLNANSELISNLASRILVYLTLYLSKHYMTWHALKKVAGILVETARVASSSSFLVQCVCNTLKTLSTYHSIKSILSKSFWARASRLYAIQAPANIIPRACIKVEPAVATTPGQSAKSCSQISAMVSQPGVWNSLDTMEKSNLIAKLGFLSCKESQHIINETEQTCRLCASGHQLTQFIEPNRPMSTEFNSVLDLIVSSDGFLNDDHLKLVCLKSIRRIWSSFQPSASLFQGSECLFFVISSLRSSNRQSRLTAASILPCLICLDNPSIQEANFKYLATELQNLYMASLSGVQPRYIAETILIAWGQLARVCDEDLLNYVCIQLIDALGESYLSSVSIIEIQAAAKARNKAPYNLLFPFWPTVTLKVIRSSLEVPTILNAFCRLVGLSLSRFAKSCMPYVVPYLVADVAKSRNDATKQSSLMILKELSRAADMDNRTMHFNNSVTTIAVLLDQAPRTAKEVWQSLDPAFQEIDWSQMISSYLLDIGCEILKLGHDVTRTLEALERYKVRRAKSCFVFDKSRTNQPLFVERNMAPLVLKLSVDISRSSVPESSKLACLTGLRSMLQRIQKDDISSALPQVCTLLQSAMDHAYLQVSAVQSWAALLQSLGSNNLKTVVVLTMSVIAQKYFSLGVQARKEAKNLILWLYETHHETLTNVMRELGIPDMSHIDQDLIFKTTEKRTIVQTLNGFIWRCQSDNVYVVRQTLQELHSFLRRTHSERADMNNYEFYNTKVAQILRQVGELPRKFPKDPRVPLLAAKCLGETGGLQTLGMDEIDSIDEGSKTRLSSLKDNLVIKENFLEKNESIDFVQCLIENFLVRSYVGAVDTNRQLFAAYGIQELLKFCGVESLQKLSAETQMVVAPLRETRYSTGEYSWRQNLGSTRSVSPVYRIGISYERWLQELSYNLIDQLQGQNSQSIFCTVRTITRDFADSTPVLEFCLPYVVLCVVLETSSTTQNGSTPSPTAIVNIVEEFLTILQMKRNPSEAPFIHRLFAIVDYFKMWQRSTGFVELESGVNAILDRLPLDELAKCAFTCSAYARAALYWEQYLREFDDIERQESAFPQLQEIYAKLDDPDTLEGIATKLPNFALDQLLLHYESAGRWEDALTCWEIMGNERNLDENMSIKHLNCLVQCEKFNEVLDLCRKEEKVSYKAKVACTEVSWLSGKWNDLDYWLQRTGDCFETSTGRALQAVRTNSSKLFECYITDAQVLLINSSLLNNGSMVANSTAPFSSTSNDLGPSALLRLRALQEVEILGSLWLSGHTVSKQEFSHALESLTSTLATQNYDAIKYILSVRRAVVQCTGFPFAADALGQTWIATAKCLRKQDRFKPALRAVFNAMELIKHDGTLSQDSSSTNIVSVVNEYAKVLWDQGDQRQAVNVLEKVLPVSFVKDNEVTDSSLSLSVAIRYTSWLDELGQAGSTELISKYRRIAQAKDRWEKPHYALAKHFTKQYSAEQLLPDDRRSDAFKNGELVHNMVRSYVKVLCYGVKHVYEALPRLITTWLDFAETVDPTKVPDISKSPSNEPLTPELVLAKMHKLLLQQHIPNYILYMALPQMLSRITHSNASVVDTLIALIVEIVVQYPSQALWFVSSVANSTQSSRSRRGNDILSKLVRKLKRNDARTHSSAQVQLKTNMEAIQNFMYLCKTPVDGNYRERKCHLSDFIGDQKVDYFKCSLVVPVERLMAVNLPSSPTNLKHHRPFVDPGRIYKVLPDVVIQHSMQKPKRITVCGSDGILYKLLLKPKDDSRKDARLLQLTSTLGRFLKKDPTSSRRQLGIKTYHVNPLNEENGIIEWVDGAVPLRTILDRFLSRKPRGYSVLEIREKLGNKTLDLATKEANYCRIVKANPPVLHEWFVETYPTPDKWLEARTKFTRSCAVMSIVGYILGLGDRHCDNLLILKNGGILHVDFDCLFDKGLSLEVPERVPFRLTPNIVDVFGFTACEGTFRRSAEVTLSIMRLNEGTLKTMLETFLHDPIVEWSRTGRKRRAPTIIHGLKTARSPQEALQAVANKVAGLVGSNSIPLSVPGQVDYLIRLATSVENLSQMYIGWAAYL